MGALRDSSSKYMSAVNITYRQSTHWYGFIMVMMMIMVAADVSQAQGT